MYGSVQNCKLELRFFFAKDKMVPEESRFNSGILENAISSKKNQNKTKQTNDRNATRVCLKVKYLDQLRKKTSIIFS